jgi:hypothetical protein
MRRTRATRRRVTPRQPFWTMILNGLRVLTPAVRLALAGASAGAPACGPAWQRRNQVSVPHATWQYRGMTHVAGALSKNTEGGRPAGSG